MPAARSFTPSDTPLRGVLEASVDAVVLVRAVRDPDGRVADFCIIDANGRTACMVGEQRNGLVGTSVFERFPNSRESRLWEQCCAVLVSQRPLEITLHAPLNGQSERRVERLLVPVDRERVAITLRDVTARHLQETALAASEARYRQLFEHNGAIQMLVDADTARLIDINPAGAKFYGWPRDAMRAMFATDFEATTVEQWHEQWREATTDIATGTGQRGIREYRVANGELRRVDALVSVAELAGRRVLHFSMQELADPVRAERDPRESEAPASESRLPQAQNLETGAQLVGGIAHELNNLLTVIRGAAGFLRDSVGETSPLLEDVNAIDRATERAEALTRRLLALGRPQTVTIDAVESATAAAAAVHRVAARDDTHDTGPHTNQPRRP